MTLTMADSIYPDNLPGGYDAYLGYVDGAWPTAALLPAKFPGKHTVSLTVKGGSAVADGCDVENGDLSPQSGAEWVAQELAARGGRPVEYASAGSMAAVLAELTARKIARSRVRLLSAHYGIGKHICHPATCPVPVPMDGTQWTDSAPGVNGSRIDASLLLPDFFGTPPHPAPQEEEMAYVLDDLAHNTAAVLPVPSGKTKAVIYADHGFGSGVQPQIRVGTAPKWNAGPVVKPEWGKPATVALPAGTTEVTVGREDTGTTRITVDFA